MSRQEGVWPGLAAQARASCMYRANRDRNTQATLKLREVKHDISKRLSKAGVKWARGAGQRVAHTTRAGGSAASR